MMLPVHIFCLQIPASEGLVRQRGFQVSRLEGEALSFTQPDMQSNASDALLRMIQHSSPCPVPPDGQGSPPCTHGPRSGAGSINTLSSLSLCSHGGLETPPRKRHPHHYFSFDSNSIEWFVFWNLCSFF